MQTLLSSDLTVKIRVSDRTERVLVLRRFSDWAFSAGFGERTPSPRGRCDRTGVPLGVFFTSGSERPAGHHSPGMLEADSRPGQHSAALH